LCTGGKSPLFLYGAAAGVGKSTLLASLAAQMATGTKAAGRSAPVNVLNVFIRFCGRTRSSSAAAPLLAELGAAIFSAFGHAATNQCALSLVDARSMFVNALALATAERPVLVIIDDADVLCDREDESSKGVAGWLPPNVPPFCSVIVSASDEAFFAPILAKIRAKGR
jgi:hypothetical protein